MKKISLLFFSFFTIMVLYAQVAVRVDNTVLNTGGAGFQVMGMVPTGNLQMVELVKGSPFYNEKWIKSKVVTEKGSVYSDIPVKVNLYESNIHYQDGSGNELVVNTPLSEVLFEKDAAGKRVHFIHGSLLPGGKKGWYQLLVNDTITLVKGFRKSLEAHTSYGSAKEYSIATTENYYVFYNGKEYDIKKPADMTAVLPGKNAAIEAYIKKIGKQPREEQLESVVAFCNTLL